MKRKCDQPVGSLEGTQRAKAAVVHPSPSTFKLLPGSPPLVDIPLSDLAPALEASHHSSLLPAVSRAMYASLKSIKHFYSAFCATPERLSGAFCIPTVRQLD